MSNDYDIREWDATIAEIYQEQKLLKASIEGMLSTHRVNPSALAGACNVINRHTEILEDMLSYAMAAKDEAPPIPEHWKN